MKILTKISQGTAALLLMSSLAFVSVTHAAPGTGQITSTYKIENLTKGTAFANPATADKCDTLQYRIRLWNPGAGSLSNLKIELSLSSAVSTTNTSTAFMTADNADPASASDQATVNLSSAQSVNFVPGSAQLLDSNTNLVRSLPDSIMNMQGGLNIGNLTDSQLEFVQFQAKVSCPTPPPPPAFSCDLLDITTGDNRTVTVSNFKTSATNGATFTNADLNWGDNSTDTAVNPVIGKTHKYTADGTYTIAATAHFTVNGVDKTAGGPGCMKQVTFKAGTPPSVIPPPTVITATAAAAPSPQLVNTGAGNIVGIFAATTTAGAAGYRWMTSRRLSRQ